MPRSLSSRQVQWTALLAAALLLLALVAVVAWPVWRELRAQVLERESTAVAAVARLQRDLGVARFEQLGLEATVDDVFEALLESSRLEGVAAIQLYGADGTAQRELPLEALADDLVAADQVGQASARFHVGPPPVAGAGEALALTPGPWLEVTVPLTLAGESTQRGWARYWIDGRRVAAELAAVDRLVLAIAGWAGGLGALVLVAGLGWAFTRLRRQADDLARTNRELLLHTKTAAIGAISSHLIHGLKNPLAGLAGFMAEEPEGSGGAQGEAWREAAATTRRVRSMINEVLAVLQDERDGADYTLEIYEVCEMAAMRVAEAVGRAGLTLRVPGRGAVENRSLRINGRTAALVGLVLGNLLDNAIAATPRGGMITLRCAGISGKLRIEVEDTGTGLPAAVRAAAFAPVRSTKTGGAGLGLALSGQLARHAGGALELVRSDARGTCFRLAVPVVTAVVEERGTR